MERDNNLTKTKYFVVKKKKEIILLPLFFTFKAYDKSTLK